MRKQNADDGAALWKCSVKCSYLLSGSSGTHLWPRANKHLPEHKNEHTQSRKTRGLPGQVSEVRCHQQSSYVWKGTKKKGFWKEKCEQECFLGLSLIRLHGRLHSFSFWGECLCLCMKPCDFRGSVTSHAFSSTGRSGAAASPHLLKSSAREEFSSENCCEIWMKRSWAVDSHPAMCANCLVYTEFIIFNPSVIFGTNNLPLFHIEISSLMLHVGWRRCRYGCWIYLPYICCFFLLQPLEAQYRSERMIAFDTACVPADCLLSHKRREFYGFNSGREAAEII